MLYLHLGMPKSGSSVLQRCLAAKSADEEFELLYPKLFREEAVAHHALARIIRSEGLEAASVRVFLDSLENSRPRDVVVSSEAFTTLIGAHSGRSIVDFWKKCRGIVPTKLVVVVRRADQFMESMYLQSTRFGNFKGDIEAHIGSRRGWYGRFLAGLGLVKTEVGSDLIVLPYVEQFDILAMFEQLAGLPRGTLCQGRDDLPNTAKLTAKSQALLLHLASVNEKISCQIARRDILRSIARGELTFSNDFKRYTIVESSLARELQLAALQAAYNAGISEYSTAFSQVATSVYPFVKLDRVLLTDEDLMQVSRALRGRRSHKDSSGIGRCA